MNLFVRFLEESEDTKKFFQNYLTFNILISRGLGVNLLLLLFDLLPSETKVDEHWPTPLVDIVVTMKIGNFLTGCTNFSYSVARPGKFLN